MNHPLRPIRALTNDALAALSADFERLYSKVGRPSIPPEKLVRALLLQAFYSIRSERQLMEQLNYNLLFRWFVGLGMDAPVWDVTVFTKNRNRLLEGEVAAKFLAAVVAQASQRNLLSEEHFSVDGTMIEGWASMKSFRPKDDDNSPGPGRNGERDFHGDKRSNETHASTTDPEIRLYRKADGQPARLAFLGHVLMENRSALVVDACLTQANGTAEREAALTMLGRLKRGKSRITLGADKAYDVAGFVRELRRVKVTPHITRNDHLTKTGKRRRSAIDARTTRHPGYAISQCIRKRVEEIFGWKKTTGGLRKTKHRGTRRVGWTFTLHSAAYNLVRLPKLLAP